MTDRPLTDNLTSPEIAREIYQAHLDVSTKLVFARNGSDYCDHVNLPYVFHTGAGEQIIESHEDMVADIGQIHDWLRGMGATDFHRIARRARFVGDDLIEGFHVTYALRGAIPVIEPYTTRSLLQRTDDHWRLSFAEHEIADALYPGHDARPAHGVFKDVWGDTAGRVTREAQQALPTYQATIDAMSEAINTNDFDAWVAQFKFPYEVHYDAVDHVAKTPEDVRTFFEMMLASMSRAEADTLVRTATYAAYVSDDRILGYHDTTMVKDGELRFGPIKSRMILVRENGRWLCSVVTNSLSNTGFPGGDFQPSDLLPTMRQIQERMKT